MSELGDNVAACFREHGQLSEENADLRKALQRIADLEDNETGEPLDDAIRIAKRALALRHTT